MFIEIEKITKQRGKEEVITPFLLNVHGIVSVKAISEGCELEVARTSNRIRCKQSYVDIKKIIDVASAYNGVHSYTDLKDES